MSKKEKITTGYSELQILFKELNVDFSDSGPVEKNLGKQVHICIKGEQGEEAVWLFFDVDSEGNETFVCQE